MNPTETRWFRQLIGRYFRRDQQSPPVRSESHESLAALPVGDPGLVQCRVISAPQNRDRHCSSITLIIV